MPACTFCLNNGFQCEYIASSKKPGLRAGYVRQLEGTIGKALGSLMSAPPLVLTWVFPQKHCSADSPTSSRNWRKRKAPLSTRPLTRLPRVDCSSREPMNSSHPPRRNPKASTYPDRPSSRLVIFGSKDITNASLYYTRHRPWSRFNQNTTTQSRRWASCSRLSQSSFCPIYRCTSQKRGNGGLSLCGKRSSWKLLCISPSLRCKPC